MLTRRSQNNPNLEAMEDQKIKDGFTWGQHEQQIHALANRLEQTMRSMTVWRAASGEHMPKKLSTQKHAW